MTSPIDATPGFFHASTRVAAITKQAAPKPEPTAPPRGRLCGSSDLSLGLATLSLPFTASSLGKMNQSGGSS